MRDQNPHLLVLVCALARLSSGEAFGARDTQRIRPTNNDLLEFHIDASRRSLLSSALVGMTTSLLMPPAAAKAAPPMAIMMEEMGYFPVQNRGGDTVYIPAKVRRESTPQAIELAKYLQRENIRLYAAYWCPHCRNQREMFGREALQYVNYVECAPKGYGFDAKTCKAADLEGFPTWKDGKRKEIGSGEMTLESLAKATGFPGKFDGSLEPLPMSGSCQLNR